MSSSPPGPVTEGWSAVFAVFATSFLARPVGAIVVGLRADRYGRRGALAGMVLLMCGATAAIGLLPSWSTIGVAAPVALVLLRLVQGFASGGQLSPSITFLLESGTRSQWGRLVGLAHRHHRDRRGCWHCRGRTRVRRVVKTLR